MFQAQKVPEAHVWKLDSVLFNDFSLTKDDMLVASIRIFLDLGFVRKFRIEYEVCCIEQISRRKNVSYRNLDQCSFQRLILNFCISSFHIKMYMVNLSHNKRYRKPRDNLQTPLTNN